MKSRYKIKYVGLVLGATMLVTPALASTVFMLQFGSYQSNDEAQAHLDELKNKHVGALSRLTMSVRPVTLPPDNLTVYRTQGGPLATRADAQSVCSQLASNGDECYIVETAMNGAVGAAPAMAGFVQSAPSVSSPTPAPVAEVPAPTVQAIAPYAAPSTPAPAFVPAPADSAEATPPANLPPTDTLTVVNRDSQNIAAMNNVTSGTANAEVNDAQATAAENSVRQALDDAAVRQQNEQTNTSSPTSARRHRSFWERINPFSSSDESEAPAVKPVSDTASAVPVDAIVSEPAPAPALVPLASAAVPSTSAPALVPLPVAPTPSPAAPATVASATPIVVPVAPTVSAASNTAAVNDVDTSTPPAPPPTPLGAVPSAPLAEAAPAASGAAVFPLPPPPAPLHGYQPQSSAVSAATASVAPPPVPVESRPLPPLTAGNGNVRVGEAQRVPLSNMQPSRPAPIITPAPLPPIAMAPSVNLSPSATVGQRTMWAEIGKFASSQRALQYWASYRSLHPDFPVVRVRVVNSLAQQQRDVVGVNLRVGPFTRPEFITNLCSSLTAPDAEPEPGMHCGQVSDLGVAMNPYATVQGGYLSGSRYHR